MRLDGIIADARNDLNSIAYAITIADKLNIPFWYIRKQKEHGTRKEIEGDIVLLGRMIKQKKDIYVLKKYKYKPYFDKRYVGEYDVE